MHAGCGRIAAPGSLLVRFLLLLLLLLGPALLPAHADIGVVIADPTHIGSARWTHAGHSSIYLSGVCPETPVRLRLCRPGEQGSVLTTFPDFEERHAYGWNIVPLSLYLWGTNQAQAQPLYASAALHRARESVAAAGFLGPVCGGACPPVLHAYWRDLVDATTARDVYIFAARTSRQQDAALVERMNALPNDPHYHAMTNNCADFVRELVNADYPGAIHRDALNDLGMMGPKSAARTFSQYAEAHPEAGFYVMHFIQQPSSIPRSGTAQAGTESAFHQPRYLLPAALIGDHEVAGSFFVAYYATGRFSLRHTYEHFAATRERAAAGGASLGTEDEWKRYRLLVAGALKDAVADGTLRSRRELRAFYTDLDRESIPAIDPRGHAWVVWHPGREDERRAGAEWANIAAPESDRWLARRLMLARMDAELRGPAQQRPTLTAFAGEWALLQSLGAEPAAVRETHSEPEGAAP